jgi:hypothetical protein
MPLLLLVPLLLVALLALILLAVPLSLVQRYRVGTARRPARGWVSFLNLLAITMSIALFVCGAALTNVWVPDALRYTMIGLGAGGLLGIVGLWSSKWERTGAGLFYTPNRWLVLGVTFVVTARILYGFWRSWAAWRSGLHGGSWMVASGVAGSLGAGGIVLGYYFVYWLGVRHQLRRHAKDAM